MHPLIAYDLAKLRVSEAHRLAERERQFRIGDDVDDATRGVAFPTRPILPRPILPRRLGEGLGRGLTANDLIR